MTTNHIDTLLAAEQAVSGDHLCPGCGRHVRHGQVGCWRCWTSIPAGERAQLTAAFRRREADPIAFARAVLRTTDLIVNQRKDPTP